MDKQEKMNQRQEAAALAQQLLQAAKANEASQGNTGLQMVNGKMVNAYGQEEVGISKRELRKKAISEMYSQSTEAVNVNLMSKRKRASENDTKYVPRSYSEQRYEMGKGGCWGLSTTKSRTAKGPLIRSSDPNRRRAPVPDLPPDEPNFNFLDR
mmetsp:Transcript_46016/g.72087  ORF Transcript_46016/g.72087 Transcript_46016/m.72087 type:complete len:154 (+) Transcript_46016:56-517(+)